MRKIQPKIKKVLFYTHSPRAFRTTLIGHLYEIAQIYPSILLSDKLDFETEEALFNKELFPKLEKIIPVQQITGNERNLLSKNRYLYQIAKKNIKQYRPDVVISASDTHSLLELYLFRFSKKINALRIAIQPTMALETKKAALWVDLTNAYLRFPSFLSLRFRLYLVKIRKHLDHFLYYWILPVTVGEKPFFGKSSHILRKGNSGMRDADYQIAFSKRDYDIFLKDGVPAKKLWILSHPLIRKTREFFEKVYFNRLKRHKKDAKIVSLMLETSIGFKRKDYSLISREEREKIWIEIIKLTSQILPGWKIYIKPHPDTKNFDEIKESFESISNNIEVVNPQEPADKYIEIGDIIIGLPLSASTTLFTAFLQRPEKPIISLDFHQELLGDVYKDFNGVEYIDNKEKFIKILKLIQDNKYPKKYQENKERKIKGKEFSNTVELLEYLYKIKK